MLDEWFHDAPPAEHERVGDMDQRRDIDIRHPVGDQLDEAPVDAAILGALLVAQRPVIMDEAAAPGGKRQPPGIGLDADVPGLRAGLAPVELRPFVSINPFSF